MCDRWHLLAHEERQMVKVKVAVSGLWIFGECLFSQLSIYIHIFARCLRSDCVFDIKPMLREIVLKLWIPLQAEHLNMRGAFGLMHWQL